ncbi:putative origin recognition complex subunit 2 [Neospora caninum Liverpool]|uniref:Putative origin recognition complex subunit 2 n=1 Tax=Neospora caninum (strain Liverpool) TaxID=572307 RepID=F0VQ61_NEOCL|nr:putative origin recognition complex subunit 2 [Neospora caninum Liverpool]CBZ55858.1 putative origin recognition complex subunit 2 [Neospora caninum Liverpool]|eukprot:XP_003885884.1 putative origin recognition complex subunit 2 [Neospora caninum Liverpool]
MAALPGVGLRERPGASAGRASSVGGQSVSSFPPPVSYPSGRRRSSAVTGVVGRRPSQPALSSSFAPSLLSSASWESLLERRQQEEQQAAHDRELIIAQDAVKAEVDRNVQELREAGDQGEDGLSEEEEEWLCSQFSGFERVLLRQTVRSYPTALPASSLRSSQSSSPRQRRGDGESHEEGKAATSRQTDANTRIGLRARASTPAASSLSTAAASQVPGPTAESRGSPAPGAVWSLLLPFSHWLGVSWAAAPSPATAAGSPSSRLVPQLPRKKAGARVSPSLAPSLSVPFSFSFTAAARLFDRRRRVRQREKAFLLEQEKRDEEMRVKMFERARKRKRSTSAKNASRARRRGCDAVALSGEEDCSYSEEDEELGDGEKTGGHERDEGKTYSALADSSDAGRALHPDPATAQKADCTRLMVFDFLSCPTVSPLSDEKLPRALLRFLRRRDQTNGKEVRPEIEETCGRSSGSPSEGTRGRRLGGGEKKIEDLTEELEDETAAAVPLLARRVHQRVSELPHSNAKAKHNLLHYLLAAHSLEWKAALLSGYSILVEGFGSKKLLLDLFAHQALRASSKTLASPQTRQQAQPLTPASGAGKGDGEGQGKAVSPALSLEKLVKEVRRAAKQLTVPLYFVVHNVDAPALRGEARRAFASLAACSNIYLICSADHHMHGLLFDGAELRSLSCMYYRCHTYVDYREEVLGYWGSTCLFMPLWLRSCAGSGGLASNEGGAGGVWGSGVNFAAVVAALTTNHKRLLKCVAERQLEQLKRGEGRAVSLEALSDPLFAMAGNLDRTKILQLLVELTSHGAAVKTAVGGQEALSIRATPAQLEQLLAILEQYGI